MTTARAVGATLAPPRPAWTLWRHVLREILSPAMLGFGVFTFLLLMRSLLTTARIWINYGADLSTVLWAIVYSLPHVLVLTIPIGVLVGGLLAFGRMSADFEIVALRSAGVSILHLLPPVLAFGAVAWALNTWVFLVMMPWGNSNLNEMRWETMTTRAIGQEVKPRVFNEDFDNLVLYIEDIVERGAEWRGVFAAQTEMEPPQIVRAERAFPRVDEGGRTTFLVLENVTVIQQAADPRDVVVSLLARHQILLWSEEDDDTFGTLGKDQRAMTLAELREAIRQRQGTAAADGGIDQANDLRVEVHKKFAFPVACLVFAVLSLPLGISTQRQTTTIGFALGTGVIIVYYYFAQTGEQQGDAGNIAPWLGMWLGNIVLGLAAVLLLWKKSQELSFGIVRRLRPYLEQTLDALRAVARRHLAPATQKRSSARASSSFPRILDLYVLRNYLAIFALTFTAFLLIFVMGQWIDRATYVAVPELIPEFLRYKVFEIAYENVIPLAAVVTVLAVFSLMTRHGEIVAALAGGVSLYRLMIPVLIPASLLTAVQYGLQDYILPYTNEHAERIEQEMEGGGRITLREERTWVFSDARAVFHFDQFIDSPPRFLGLTRYDLAEGRAGLTRIEHAAEVVWDVERAGWEGRDGWRQYFEPQEDDSVRSFELEEFRVLPLDIEEPPEYFRTTERDTSRMSTLQLREHIASLRQRGYDTERALADFHLNVATPSIVFVMTMVGVPFAFSLGRKGALTGIGVAVALAIVYWIVYGVFQALAYGGQLPPALAAWAPHVVFAALGGYQALGVRS